MSKILLTCRFWTFMMTCTIEIKQTALHCAISNRLLCAWVCGDNTTEAYSDMRLICRVSQGLVWTLTTVEHCCKKLCYHCINLLLLRLFVSDFFKCFVVISLHVVDKWQIVAPFLSLAVLIFKGHVYDIKGYIHWIHDVPPSFHHFSHL